LREEGKKFLAKKKQKPKSTHPLKSIFESNSSVYNFIILSFVLF